MSKKNVQVFLTEDETSILTEAAALDGVADMRGFLSGRARALLLAWAFHVKGTRGGVRGGTCSGCTGDQPATWLVMGSRKYVCDTCAQRLNAAWSGSLPACIQSGPDRLHMPAHEWEAAWERVLAVEAKRQLEAEREATVERAELVATLVQAAAAITDYDRGVSGVTPVEANAESNADFLGLSKF